MSPAGSGTLSLSPSSDAAPAQFTHLSGTYPLKLLAPHPLPSQPANLRVCYMLAYGGGLVAGDTISLHVRVGKGSKLILLTQGSTKVFKTRVGRGPPLSQGLDGGTSNDSAASKGITRQRLLVYLDPGSLLLLLPDPIQPFKSSSYIQSQRFIFPAPSLSSETEPPANALVLDWFTSGRNVAQGSTSKYQEEWEFDLYSSMNEIVYASPPPSSSRPTDNNLNNDSNDFGKSAARPQQHLARSHVVAPVVSPSTIPFMREKVTLTNTSPPLANPTSTPPTAGGTALQARMRPYQIYATLLIHGPLLAPLINHLVTLSNSIKQRQFQAKEPDELVWSFSKVPPPREGVHFTRAVATADGGGGTGGSGSSGDGDSGGTGILRIAGTETERVKVWIEDVLVAGGVRDLVGNALWQRIF